MRVIEGEKGRQLEQTEKESANRLADSLEEFAGRLRSGDIDAPLCAAFVMLDVRTKYHWLMTPKLVGAEVTPSLRIRLLALAACVDELRHRVWFHLDTKGQDEEEEG